jgi:hypothetical protein
MVWSSRVTSCSSGVIGREGSPGAKPTPRASVQNAAATTERGNLPARGSRTQVTDMAMLSSI